MIHKTPYFEAPMTPEEVALAHGAWQSFQAYVAGLPREPDMNVLLDTFSEVVGRCFDTRSMANQAFKLAEARHFGDNRIKPFKRGVSPQSAKPLPKPKENLLKELGLDITEEQLVAEAIKRGLLSSSQDDPEGSKS